MEEEKTYCSDQEALCMEALHFTLYTSNIYLESYHKVLLEGGENYLEEELHKNKSLEGCLCSQGRAV